MLIILGYMNSIPSILFHLNWLSVCFQAQCKVLVLTCLGPIFIPKGPLFSYEYRILRLFLSTIVIFKNWHKLGRRGLVYGSWWTQKPNHKLMQERSVQMMALQDSDSDRLECASKPQSIPYHQVECVRMMPLIHAVITIASMLVPASMAMDNVAAAQCTLPCYSELW